MAIESIALNIDAADVQAMYFALQQKLNAGWIVKELIAIALPLLMFFTGWGARIYDWLVQRLRKWAAAAFIFFFAIAFIILTAQFAVLHYLITTKAGVDGSPVPGFAAFLLAKVPEAVVMSGLAALIGILLCYVLNGRYRLAWLWLSVFITAVASGALMAVPALTPKEPLGDTPVERAIAEMAGRVGIPISSIAKEHCGESDCPPGHVVGLGPTRLLLLDDRLTDRTPQDQLLQVFAHEAKHYLLDNNFKPPVLIFSICAALFFVTQTLLSAVLARQRRQYAVISDHAGAIPLVFGIGLATFMLLQPAITTYRVHLEFEADRFGLELDRNNQALIDIMRTYAAENPMLYRHTAVTRYFRATHPEIRARIRFAETYRPWLNDEPMVYAPYFRE